MMNNMINEERPFWRSAPIRWLSDVTCRFHVFLWRKMWGRR